MKHRQTWYALLASLLVSSIAGTEAQGQQSTMPYDAQAIEKLLAGDFESLGRSSSAVAGAFVVMKAVGASGCPPQRPADLGVSEAEIGEATFAVPRKYPEAMTMAMAMLASAHPLYFETLALVDRHGCGSEQMLRLMKNTVRYVVWLNRGSTGRPRKVGPTVDPSAEVAPPTVVEEGRWFTTFRYGPVPEDFRPPIPELPPDRVAVIKMQKQRAGSLVHISTSQNAYTAVMFTPAAEQIERERRHGNPAKDEILTEDLVAIDGAVVLECHYLGAVEGALEVRYYWYQNRPTAADPNRLRERLQNHPLLNIGGPQENCPVRLEQ